MGCLNHTRRSTPPFAPRGSIRRRFELKELGARARASSGGCETKGRKEGRMEGWGEGKRGKKENFSSFLLFVFLSLVNQMQPRFSGACNSWRGGNICRSRRMRIPQVKPAFSGILKFSFVAASLYREPNVVVYGTKETVLGYERLSRNSSRPVL